MCEDTGSRLFLIVSGHAALDIAWRCATIKSLKPSGGMPYAQRVGAA